MTARRRGMLRKALVLVLCATWLGVLGSAVGVRAEQAFGDGLDGSENGGAEVRVEAGGLYSSLNDVLNATAPSYGQLSPACQLHREALGLLAQLRPAGTSRLSPYPEGLSSNGAPSSQKVQTEGDLSFGSNPLMTLLRLPTRLISMLIRYLLLEPFPILEGALHRAAALLHGGADGLVGGVWRATGLGRVEWGALGDLLRGRAEGARGEGAGGPGEMAYRVLRLLERATEGARNETCDAAWMTRGMVALLPLPGLAADLALAHRALQVATEMTADPVAQYALGFMHAAGLGPAERDQAKALLYYSFAALQGLTEAQMALGYRYWSGIGVKEDCMEALGWYEAAAERAYAHFLAGPPGGRALPLTPTKQSDLAGGVYGPGASWASTGAQAGRAAIKAANAAASGERYDDVLEYYQYHADRGSHRDTVILGRIFYLGSVYSVPGGVASGAEGVGSIGQDLPKAHAYFLRVARALWATDPPLIHISAHGSSDGLPEDFGAKTGARAMSKEAEAQLHGSAAVAAGLLGRMYLRGEAVEQDFLLARMWLKRASDLGDREAQSMLGLVYRDGLGVKALSPAWWGKFFQSAASQDHAEAKTQLGKYHYELGEFEPAVVYLNQAIQHGNPFEAFYYLAKIHAARAVAEDHAAHHGSSGSSGTCGVAVSFFKVVAERGNWQHDVIGDGDRSWRNGEQANALLQWWMAAEMGYETALNNVAFTLDNVYQAETQTRSSIPPAEQVADADFMALTHWSRSAGQQNVDALVKVGDYYYDGVGVGPHENRFEKAAAWYQSAADTQASAIAFWNLGWMYENGLGVAQDWHLAKRYYDLSRDTSAESYLPVTLSLIKLHARSWWAGLTGRGASGNGPSGRLRLWGRDDDDGEQPARTGPDRAYLGGGQDDAQGQQGYAPDGQRDGEEWDGWGNDNSLEESEHVRAGAEGYDEQLGYGRRPQGDRGARREDGRVDWEDEDDYADIEIDEELAETLAIGLLVVGLAGLFWVRGQWMRRAREEREAEEQRRRGGGAAGAAGAAGPAEAPEPARAVPEVRFDDDEWRGQDAFRRMGVPIDFAPLPI